MVFIESGIAKVDLRGCFVLTVNTGSSKEMALHNVLTHTDGLIYTKSTLFVCFFYSLITGFT